MIEMSFKGSNFKGQYMPGRTLSSLSKDDYNKKWTITLCIQEVSIRPHISIEPLD